LRRPKPPIKGGSAPEEEEEEEEEEEDVFTHKYDTGHLSRLIQC